jgi:hypothetical protein
VDVVRSYSYRIRTDTAVIPYLTSALAPRQHIVHQSPNLYLRFPVPLHPPISCNKPPQKKMSEIQGITPQDATQPEKLLGGCPNPPPPPNPLPSTDTLKSWLPLYLHKTDNVIEHLARLISTPAGTDSVLMTIGYGSLLTSTILTSVSLHRLRNAARQIIEKAMYVFQA